MSLRYTVLSFSLALCLAACGGDDPASSSDAGTDSASDDASDDDVAVSTDSASTDDGGAAPDDSGGSTAVMCFGPEDCAADEVCTTQFGDCNCDGMGTGAGDMACCGTCQANPCNGLDCGDYCDCPSGVPCTEIARACNSDGHCVTAMGDLGCEEPLPYDPCADLPCGSSCNPCAPDDQDCQERPMLEHWCNADGSCTDNVDNEPPLCEATSCMSSADCGGGEACTTDFFDCVTCEGSDAAVCCGTCVANPCAGLACGDSCACPPGMGCPEVPWACNSDGQCVTASNVEACEEPPVLCEDQPCGTPCGDDQMCDNNGACIVSPNMPADEFCAAQAAQCMSSADCEVGEACSVLYDDCQPCVGSEMLTVCCGTCETFAPCTGLACGDSCSTCPPDQPECPLPMTEAEWYCQDDGTCDDSVPPCTD